MKLSKQLFVAWIIGSMLLSGSAFAESDPAPKELLIESSSADMSKVRRAFNAGTKMRQMQEIPVTINMSLGSVQYASKNFPKAQMVKVLDQSVSDMIQGFIDAGGVVYVCPMCLQGHGMAETDLLPGVKVGGPRVILPLILKDGVKMLSY